MLRSSDFKRGDRVIFGRHRGEQTLGEVVRVNKRNLKIKQLEERGSSRRRPVGTVWNVAPSLCRKVDVMGAPVAPSKRSEEELLQRIREIYSGLSPENLTCDGELSPREFHHKWVRLNRELAECFIELGRRVTEDEAFAA